MFVTSDEFGFPSLSGSQDVYDAAVALFSLGQDIDMISQETGIARAVVRKYEKIREWITGRPSQKGLQVLMKNNKIDRIV